MQDQLVCHGCRNVLLYPRGASNVCCVICSTVNMAPPHGMDMARVICGGCRTMLMYTSGASSVRCSCCQTLNFVPATGQVAHINCGHCRTMLMYPYGASSVKCAVCQYVTNVGVGNSRVPLTQSNGAAAAATMPPSTSAQPTPHAQTQTVVVENPKSVDESGKLVSNVVVGVSSGKK